MTTLLIQVLVFLKDNFEKAIFWLILAIFLFLSVRLGMQWGHSKGVGISVEAEFGLKQEGYNPCILNKAISIEGTLDSSAGLFTKKPILYYRDFYKRNAFSSVPRLKIKEKAVIKKIAKKKAKPQVEYEYTGVIDIGGRLIAAIKNKSTGKGFYVEKGELVEKLKVLDITKTYVLLFDKNKKKDLKIEIKK
ncbi:hypothetical protein KAW08_03745 [bacterium]|nr:hypothetical protein [bacterium]